LMRPTSAFEAMGHSTIGNSRAYPQMISERRNQKAKPCAIRLPRFTNLRGNFSISTLSAAASAICV
jgi:hypothetical protein